MHQFYNMRVGVNAVILRDDHILLVEFGAGWKRHFNLPGGGIEPGESVVAGLQREVREETSAAIMVGSLLLVTEYFPPQAHYQDGHLHKLGLVFRCHLHPGSEPHLPANPDPHQVAVQWVPLHDLSNQPLLPKIADQLLLRIRTPPAQDLFHEEQ